MSYEEYTVRVYSDHTEWRQNGELHRVDGPAEEYSSGEEWWYQNGKLHRVDGPAVELSNGNKEWCQNGKLHRVDGPALEWSNGDKGWYLEGTRYTKKEHRKLTQSNTCEGKTVLIDGQKYRLTLME